MRTPRKGGGGSKKERDTGAPDRSNKEDSEHQQAGQPKVTSHLLDKDLRAVKAHIRHVLRKFRSTKKGK